MPALARFGSAMAHAGMGRSASTGAIRAARSRAGGFIGGRLGSIAAAGTAAYLGYRGIKGFAGQAIPASIDAAMDVAFDNPQADRSVIGTDLTPSIYLGRAGPGIIGGMARARNATRFGIGAHTNPAKSAVGTGMVGGVIGGGIGAFMGYRRGGIGGAIGGGIIGALGGATAGGALGAGTTASMAYKTAQMNSQVINQSPFYNQSALTANRLNASGNIVLGMHNQRRG